MRPLPIVALLMGGPLAGRCVQLDNDTVNPPLGLTFPAYKRVGSALTVDTSPAIGEMPKTVHEYRLTGGPERTAGGIVYGYAFIPGDPHLRARTLEHVVGYEAPLSVQQVRDRYAVEVFLRSCQGVRP